MTSPRVAVYARVSAKRCEHCGIAHDKHSAVDHAFKGQNPAMQLGELDEYCVRRGWTHCVQFVDRASSAS